MMMPRCASHSGTSFGRLGCGRRDHSQNTPPSAFPIWPRRPLGDAIGLRNRLIEHLEEADTECAANDRESLLTLVVAGGGFAGVETIGSINDFLKAALPYYPNLTCEMVRVIWLTQVNLFYPSSVNNLGDTLAANWPSAESKSVRRRK
jgi:NADH dehydrogenase FAD-containing subunit